MRHIQLLLWTIIQLKCILCDFNRSAYVNAAKIATQSVEEWLNEVNDQYYTLSHYAAVYTWDLGVNGNRNSEAEAVELGRLRLQWKTQRCDEAEDLLDDMNDSQKRMVWILCRGPKYRADEADKLSVLLDKIQAIYTDTKICLPQKFDICLNYHRIWDFTYTTTYTGTVLPLNFTVYRPECCRDENALHAYDGSIDDDYYVFRRTTEAGENRESDIEASVRSSDKICYSIEDLEKLMQGHFDALNRTDCSIPAEIIFRWTWEAWRLAVGPSIKKFYPEIVDIMNEGAKNNGYNDIGETWREELEFESLRSTIKELWSDVKPFYVMLHGVLRNALWKKYSLQNEDLLRRNGPMPAHMLGSMWSSDWSAYEPLLLPFETLRIENQIVATNWSTMDMVKRADDFYISLGLNPMTKAFWNNSVIGRASNKTKCHGSAGNMFAKDDYRMVTCVAASLYGFYEIIHEMGHIQYYMHLKYQSPLFQDAVNSAVGEAIGDAIFLAMMVPQNLNRLRLIPDEYLAPNKIPKISFQEMRAVHDTKSHRYEYNVPSTTELFRLLNDKAYANTSSEILSDWLTINGKPAMNYKYLSEKVKRFGDMKDARNSNANRFDIALLLKLALTKIPQIPFEYILDIYRWDLFADPELNQQNANDKFWNLVLKEQGVHMPDWHPRSELFDAAVKFHFTDNTPYVRYFLASVLQAQIFKGLCEYTVFGKFHTNEALPMPLHRCDIYGSKRAGRILKKAMKLGSSVHWSEVMYILSGNKSIRIEPLLEYYEPLVIWLKQLVTDFNIPLGW